MSRKIKVLHIVGAMAPGGLENFIMNLFRNIDRERVTFDFVVHARKDGDYVPELESMGAGVFLIPRLTSHPVKNLKQIRRLVSENGYDFVIRHTANALITPQLLAAKKGGAKTICHAHSTDDPAKLLHKLGRMLMKKAADYRFACSEDAGKWMYGNLGFTVVKNALDIREFAYSSDKDEDIRREFDCEERPLFGHIGNLLEVKNHLYLMDIYAAIIKRMPNALCFCIGEGDMRSKIESRIEELGISDNVILTGIRFDVPKFMSALDVLIFPSIFEGLPLSLIEAQAASLPMIISDRITGDVEVTEGIVRFMSIDLSPDEWAKKAIEIVGELGAPNQKSGSRIEQREAIAKHGYDIEELCRFYESFFEENSTE